MSQNIPRLQHDLDFFRLTEDKVFLLVAGERGTPRLSFVNRIKGTKLIITRVGVPLYYRTKGFDRKSIIRAFGVYSRKGVQDALRRSPGRHRPDWVIFETWDELAPIWDEAMRQFGKLGPLDEVRPLTLWEERRKFILDDLLLAAGMAKVGVILTCHARMDPEIKATRYEAPEAFLNHTVAMFEFEGSDVIRCEKALPFVSRVCRPGQRWRLSE